MNSGVPSSPQESPTPQVRGQLDFRPLDSAFAAEYDADPNLADRWLLAQTLATAAARRATLPMLGVRAGERVVDLGTGFGPLALEIAGTVESDVVGVDSDFRKLELASRVGAEVSADGWTCAGSSLTWQVADVTALPLVNASVDRVVARLLLQHLPDPRAAIQETVRILRPGGSLHVIDVDDDLNLSWPPPSEAQSLLEETMRQAQSKDGGDRHIGRKIPALMDESGLEVRSAVVVSQSGYQKEPPLSRAFALDRFRRARETVINYGIVEPDIYDNWCKSYSEEPYRTHFVTTAQLVISGDKRT